MARPTQNPVCIIDDDDPVRASIELLLRTRGYAAASFESALDFLHFIRSGGSPGCALVDLQMAGFSGIQLLELLQAERREIVCIAMTGHQETFREARILRAGALTILRKPFGELELIEGIERALATAQASRSTVARPEPD